MYRSEEGLPLFLMDSSTEMRQRPIAGAKLLRTKSLFEDVVIGVAGDTVTVTVTKGTIALLSVYHQVLRYMLL